MLSAQRSSYLEDIIFLDLERTEGNHHKYMSTGKLEMMKLTRVVVSNEISCTLRAQSSIIKLPAYYFRRIL